MEHTGIDVHKNSCQVCVLTEDGGLVERRIKTERASLSAMSGDRPGARILIESSAESEWVARCLAGLGHKVTVADPNFAPMYATLSEKVKTDKRDARTLCEACRLGAYRPAHRTPERQVGPVTATTDAATLDGAARCRDAKQVRPDLGLVPREHSSGEKQRRGRISKAGNSRARSLLVEAAWAPLRWKTPKTQAPHEWAARIAARRGKATAVVALARKLAGILFALWRGGTEFEPGHRMAAAGA